MIAVINSLNANTPVTLIDGQLDLRAYTEPTLSILQTAYDAGDYEIIPDPEPVVEQPLPDWDALYGQLMSSESYQFVLLTSLSIPNLASALGVVIDSIQYGIMKPESQAALPAFQSAINVLLMVMDNVQQTFTTEQLADVRLILNNNGFQNIQL